MKEEKGHIDDKEMRGELSLEETIALLKDAGYLDTSFEGKETHPLAIRALSKEEALEEYKTSGGKAGVWDEFKINFPYTTPKAETLDVMMMNFGKEITRGEADTEMGKFGVRPLTYEEFVQFISVNPSFDEQNPLVALSDKHTGNGAPRVAFARFSSETGRSLCAARHSDNWNANYRFPVVRK